MAKTNRHVATFFADVTPADFFLWLTGDELHFFHIVPNPQAKLLGGGMGLADAGEFMVAPPDPKDDRKQVGLWLRAERAMTCCHVWACKLTVNSQSQVMCIDVAGSGGNLLCNIFVVCTCGNMSPIVVTCQLCRATYMLSRPQVMRIMSCRSAKQRIS